MTKTTQAADEAAIRDGLASWAAAARVRDIDAIMAHYAPGIRAFDAIFRLQFQGADAYRQHWADCLQHMQGDMLFEIHDLEVAAAGDVAFCHFLCRAGGTDTEGTDHACWMRGTVCLRRIDGAWRHVHEHFSSPFDPMTSQVQFDLQPDAATRRAA